ncbi:MAG TPA: hypothetical protein VM030_03295 [Acidimicrobiales bacterium]|nr:hypothetical protein [Acidimicrobiales bacterium]
MADISRRGFLAAGAGLMIAAACGGGGKEGDDATANEGTTGATTPSSVAPDKSINVVLGSFNLLAGVDQRVSFGILRGQRPVDGSEEVLVRFGKVGDEVGGALPATRRATGIENRPIHVVRNTFTEPGTYRAVATVGGVSGEAALTVIDPATSRIPVPGSEMPRLTTPTSADHRGVEPICTRQPTCPWHDVSLDAALAEKRPVVLLISTPALCQSQVCGPVLDILLGLRESFEAKVRFIHAEVYTDKTGATTTPTVQGFNLENEPWLFLAGADGRIRERLEGPYDRTEAAEALTRLVESK